MLWSILQYDSVQWLGVPSQNDDEDEDSDLTLGDDEDDLDLDDISPKRKR